jgi:DeoR/GlpR family transcriptional regulator of sugar metabolism
LISRPCNGEAFANWAGWDIVLHNTPAEFLQEIDDEMRIFLSHTGKQKPLIREVMDHFPHYVRPWFDEKDLFVGENIGDGIKGVIEKHTDFVIIFVDSHAVASEWVQQELQWALEYEQKLGRTFVLPVVLDREAWDRIEPEELRKRKFLECVDLTEEGVKALANGLIYQLFSWVSRDLALPPKQPPLESSLKLIDEADRYLKKVANEIRVFVHSYNRDNPLPLNELFDFLRDRDGSLTEEGFHDLLARLRQQGYLAGLVYDTDVIFVEEEHYGWKTTVFTDAKQKIARRAVSFIRSGQVIALDAGSTTNEIARLICSGLKRRMWNKLTIVTNSIPASNQLVTAGDELGLEDQNDVLRVFVAGGRVRPNTLAIVDDASLSNTAGESNLERLLADLGGADLGYVGTNGIYWGLGFTTSDITETTTKAALLKGSRRKFVVTDPSKFDIRQGKVFAKFDENIEVITTRGAGTVLSDYELKFKDTTTSIIYVD